MYTGYRGKWKEEELIHRKERIRVYVFVKVKNCYDGHSDTGELGW